MSGVDPEIFIIFIGAIVLIGCLVIVRQFLSSDKSKMVARPFRKH